LLAAREFVDAAITVTAEANEIEITLDLLGNGAGIMSAHFQGKGDVFGGGHVRKKRELLEHHADGALVRWHGADRLPVDEDFTAGRAVKAGNHAQQRRLARTGRAEDGQETALGQIKRGVLDGVDIAEGHSHVFDGHRDAASGRIDRTKCCCPHDISPVTL